LAFALETYGTARNRHSYVLAMAVRRIVAYAGGEQLAASRDFYVEVLGMRVSMEDPVLDLQSPENPTAEVIIGAQEMQDARPSFGVDVGEPAAVDAAHAEAVRRGLRVVYPLTDEPWGVRRFFVEDPGGTVINVLAHM
jgi:catechol 2,3-dioxygenase-like lactoylglutathione lyase family enzyme